MNKGEVRSWWLEDDGEHLKPLAAKLSKACGGRAHAGESGDRLSSGLRAQVLPVGPQCWCVPACCFPRETVYQSKLLRC